MIPGGLRAQVQADPGVVMKLRCLFMKMRSLMEVPLLRLGQARPPRPALRAFLEF
jgi:hypothetical protein